MDIVTYADLKLAGHSDRDIQSMYGASDSKWRAVLTKLGVIERNEYAYWEEEEITYILDNYKKLTIKEISRRLGRGEISVRSKMSSMGLKFSINKKDNEYIKRNYKHMTDEEMSEVLNRPIVSIGLRRVRMGCGRVTGGWSEKEEMYLQENFQTLTDAEIAYVLDRTEGSIRGKRKRMGLSRD